MHASDLAFYSALFASLCMFFAAGVWLMLWTRSRRAYMLPTALCWLALCVYFGAFAVSAGTAPVVSRNDIADLMRYGLFVVGGLVVLGKVMLLRAQWRNGAAARHNNKGTKKPVTGVTGGGGG